jgi:hypothetical protein
VIAGMLALAAMARPGQQGSVAQTTQSPAVAPTTVSSPATAPSAPGTTAPAPKPELAKQETLDAASAARKKQIADDCANLLNLANNLKAAMDKTDKNTLSVTVVRKAGEIEQLAHSMRTK